MIAQIKINNINKSFNNKNAIKHITFDIEKNDSIAILGCSGSGKSVLIKIISGLLKPDSGQITVDNDSITNVTEKHLFNIMSSMSVLFQGGALFDSMSVWKNVCFGMNGDFNKEQKRKIAIKYLKMVGMDRNIADLYPAELSGGMQKRVALARALIKNPKIIFLDEPTTGLDPILAEIIDDLIMNFCINKMTTIMVTHNVKSACKIANRIIVLDNGKMIFNDLKQNIFDSQNPHIQKLLKAGGV